MRPLFQINCSVERSVQILTSEFMKSRTGHNIKLLLNHFEGKKKYIVIFCKNIEKEGAYTKNDFGKA